MRRQTIFMDFINNPKRLKIIEYFVEWEDYTIKLSDIGKSTGYTHKDIELELTYLIDLKMIRVINAGYKVNLKNKLFVAFRTIFNIALSRY